MKKSRGLILTAILTVLLIGATAAAPASTGVDSYRHRRSEEYQDRAWTWPAVSASPIRPKEIRNPSSADMKRYGVQAAEACGAGYSTEAQVYQEGSDRINM